MSNEHQDSRAARGGGYQNSGGDVTQDEIRSGFSDDKKPGCGKRVTWDELVHVRQFEAFKEELKETYPRTYPYKHSNRQRGQDNGQNVQSSPVHNQQSQYFTSPTFDL